MSERPSAAAAAEQSASVVIEPAPLASQLAPDVKLVTDPYGSAGVGGGGDGGDGGDGLHGGHPRQNALAFVRHEGARGLPQFIFHPGLPPHPVTALSMK